MRRVNALAALLVTLALALLVGCGPNIREGGFRQNAGKRNWDAGFGAWDGAETHDLKVAGKRELKLRYTVQVEEGSITFVLRDRDANSVWEYRATSNAEGAEVIPLTTPGDYKLTAYGSRATGDFEFSWKAR